MLKLAREAAADVQDVSQRRGHSRTSITLDTCGHLLETTGQSRHRGAAEPVRKAGTWKGCTPYTGDAPIAFCGPHLRGPDPLGRQRRHFGPTRLPVLSEAARHPRATGSTSTTRTLLPSRTRQGTGPSPPPRSPAAPTSLRVQHHSRLMHPLPEAGSPQAAGSAHEDSVRPFPARTTLMRKAISTPSGTRHIETSEGRRQPRPCAIAEMRCRRARTCPEASTDDRCRTSPANARRAVGLVPVHSTAPC